MNPMTEYSLIPAGVQVFPSETPYLCVHEPLEFDGENWYIFAVPGKGIYIRVCKHCRLLYADLTLGQILPKEPQ